MLRGEGLRGTEEGRIGSPSRAKMGRGCVGPERARAREKRLRAHLLELPDCVLVGELQLFQLQLERPLVLLGLGLARLGVKGGKGGKMGIRWGCQTCPRALRYSTNTF
jgi:hypothetical protein